METCVFHGETYGKYNSQLFIFETTWDSFRPIERVAWNGERFAPIDSKYKTDLFDEHYGYGSLEMKALCRKLTQDTEFDNAHELKDPVAFWKWTGETSAKWWKDRACVFTNDCVSRDSLGWKKYLYYLNVRAKTLRQKPRVKMTRRLRAI
jgi:hypothetical protein